MSLTQKILKLDDIIRRFHRPIVAFSGGTDSAFLLKVAADVLGKKNVIAVTAVSETYSEEELESARNFASGLGVKHILLKTSELKSPDFFKNTPERCYFCKKEFFGAIADIKKQESADVVIDGYNADDENDYRPGHRAAVEYAVKSPLSEAGFSKDEIRAFSRKMNLLTWDRPSNPCLASRFPYGSRITAAKLKVVAESEKFIRSLGFKNLRVRHHGKLARIELEPRDMSKMLKGDTRLSVYRELKKYGFTWISLDILGYRTGSLNEILKKNKKVLDK